MLLYPIPQSLGCAYYIAKITPGRKLINNGTLLGNRNAILLNEISLHQMSTEYEVGKMSVKEILTMEAGERHAHNFHNETF